MFSFLDENGQLPLVSSATSEEAAEESASEGESLVPADEAVEAIITSTRTGKAISTYEAIYEDPSVQEALKSGDDTQARGFIKEKLCSLGYVKEVRPLQLNQWAKMLEISLQFLMKFLF